MRPFRPTVGVLAVCFWTLSFFGCVPSDRTADGGPGPQRGDAQGETLSASIPARDARGEPIPSLPRYPGSVRTAYSEDEADGLALVRAEYLTGEKPGAVNGFWRDAFRSGSWQVANVEYSDGAWDFVVLRGEREAEVGVLPRDGGSEVRVEVSVPAGGVAQEGRPSAGGSKR